MNELDREARVLVYKRMRPLLLVEVSLPDVLARIRDEAAGKAATGPGSPEAMLELRVSGFAEFLRSGESTELPRPRLVPSEEEAG